jgi:hypothetical protein
MATVKEIEERRAARKAAAEKAREEQYAKDLEALDELEQEHGDGKVVQLDLPAFTVGLPTMVVVRTPTDVEHRRYRDMVRRSKGKGDEIGKATDLLADVCRVYPDDDTYEAVRKAHPGVHDSIAVQAIKLAEARTAEEGKG